MSVDDNFFEELAHSAGIEFIHDNDANTLIIEDVGSVDLNHFVPLVKRYAYKFKMAKISIKVKESNAIYFFQHGFKVEASIMAYYGLQDAFYIVYYLEDSYQENQFEQKHNAILDASFHTKNDTTDLEGNNITVMSGIATKPIDGMHQLVFSSREAPTPKKNVENKFCAQVGNTIAATANAYHCSESNVVEFSTFTVNSTLEPKNVINQLLAEMESYYASMDCKTAYTTVPASSLMINSICAENDFEFGGRLMNESLFKGKLDSLNAWSKQL